MKLIRKGVADKIRETFSLIKHEMQQNSRDFFGPFYPPPEKTFWWCNENFVTFFLFFQSYFKRILICCFFLSDENSQVGAADIYQSSKSCLALTLQNVKCRQFAYYILKERKWAVKILLVQAQGQFFFQFLPLLVIL